MPPERERRRRLVLLTLVLVLFVVVLVQIKMDGDACCPLLQPLASCSRHQANARKTIDSAEHTPGGRMLEWPVFQAVTVLPFGPATFFVSVIIVKVRVRKCCDLKSTVRLGNRLFRLGEHGVHRQRSGKVNVNGHDSHKISKSTEYNSWVHLAIKLPRRVSLAIRQGTK